MADKRIDTQGRIEAVRFQNQTGSPAAPAAGYTLLYMTANGLYMEPSGGAVIGPFVTGANAGRTLIDEKTPNGTGSITFLSIPGTYNTLLIEYVARGNTNADSVSMDIVINGDTTDANYRMQLFTAYAIASGGATGDNNVINDAVIAATGPANEASQGFIEIPYYAKTTFNKQISARHGHRRDVSSVHEQIDIRWIDWESTAAITQIGFVLAAGGFAAGSTFRLYGMS